MTASSRVVRGDNWARVLQGRLAMGPADARSWMEQNTGLLKSDPGSRVGLLQLEQELCCLKLYLHKSSMQRWLFRLGRGRPVHSFDMAAELAAAGLPVAQPRACLRVAQGMLLLTGGIADASGLQTLWLSGLDEDQSHRLLAGSGAMLARLHRAGYAHGDCKWPNLLWAPDKCWLIDLDAAGRAGPGSTRQARDLARFTLNAEELGVDPGQYELFLDTYLEGVGEPRDKVIRRMMPMLRKLRARHLAKYGARGGRLF